MSSSLGLVVEPMPLRYGLYEHPARVRDICARPAAGCAISGLVVAAEPLHAHELAHSVLGNRGLNGTRALQEGAASVFGCGVFSMEDIEPELPIEHLVDGDAFYAASLEVGYGGAMSFVAFLLDLGGVETFTELLAHTNDWTGSLGLDSELLALYGSDAAELLMQWTALGPQPTYRLCRRVYECAAPAWTGDRVLELERGVADDVAHAGAVRTLTVERDATLRIRVDAIGAEVRVLSCERRPDVVPEGGAWTADDTASVAAGRYAIWFTALVLEGDQSSVEAEVSITIE